MKSFRPAIDHTILSPSGRVSKRARKAILEREAKRLFEGIDLMPKTKQPSEKEKLLHNAKMWRELADRGMGVRKYNKLADEAEKKAALL